MYSVISFLACVAPTLRFHIYGIIPVPAWLCVTGLFAFDAYSALGNMVCFNIQNKIAVLIVDYHIASGHGHSWTCWRYTWWRCILPRKAVKNPVVRMNVYNLIIDLSGSCSHDVLLRTVIIYGF
jgi:hypothetical protein